jgi:hypothetical protein
MILKKVRCKIAGWEIHAVREVEDLNSVETIPVYYFEAPLPKKKFSDY